MIFRFIVSWVVLASATLAEASPEPRAPSGKWHVSNAHSQCIAIRDYGAATGSPKLLIKAPAFGEVVQVAVLRDATRTSPEEVEASVVIGDRPAVATSLMMFTPAGPREPRVYLLNMPAAEFAALQQAKTFSVRSEGLNETLALSQMEPLMQVLDQCVADLRRSFNIAADGTRHVGLKSSASVNLPKLFSSDDYPAAAFRKGQGGRVGFILLIQEDGRVADCTVVETSGVPVLDSQVCALLKLRAKFEPARGIDGKPAKDSFAGGIVWNPPR
ncbi:MAG TPA: energy transducer TonB [Allosphingosinicella sp.]|nr:energy transducer TonB [Allosphingosinicella sp.]